MQTLEAVVKANGFDSVAEFHRLVCRAPMRTAKERVAFKRWQRADGTKDGLLNLCEAVGEAKLDE